MINITIRETLSATFSTLRKNLFLVLGASLLFALLETFGKTVLSFFPLEVTGSGLKSVLLTKNFFIFGVLSVFFIIAMVWATLGYFKLLLNIKDSEEASWANFFGQSRNAYNLVKFIPVVMLSILAFVLPLAFIGKLLITPGSAVAFVFAVLLSFTLLYLMVRIMFFHFFIVDKDMYPLQAMYESWNYTKGKTFKIVATLLTITTIGLIVLLLCGVVLGLLFSEKMIAILAALIAVVVMRSFVTLATIHIYRILNPKTR